MPLFITFEGPDGSGKSTQARMLADYLRAGGHPVIETREPGGTPIGERLRELFLSPEAPAATPLAMTFLLSAARSQHVTEVIVPGLRQGHSVISDRFADSTVAYQSFGEGVALEDVLELTRIATGGVEPDVSIFVDIPPEIGLQRVDQRGARNRLDSQTLAFHRRVRDGYSQLIRRDPARWICVDGTASPTTVHQDIVAALAPMLEREAETT
jgi:dTMP kinase